MYVSLSYLIGLMFYEKIRKYINHEISILIGLLIMIIGLICIGPD